MTETVFFFLFVIFVSCGSSRELVQPMMQKQYHGIQNDLKSAAACLKLTSLTN